MPWVAAAVIGSSVIGSEAARKAGNVQADAARYAADVQKQMFETQNEQQKPYREAGYSALSDIGAMKPYLTQQYTPEDFAQGIDPGYQFRLQQGQEATNRMANMGGGMLSGNALKGQQDYTQGLASQEYGNAFNRFQVGRTNIYNTLSSIAGLGQTSLGQTTAAGTTAAGNIGSNIAGAGAAQAGGIVGQANALSGGLQTLGNQQYLSNLLSNRNQVPAGYTDAGGFAGGGSGVLNVPGQGTMSIGDYFRPA